MSKLQLALSDATFGFNGQPCNAVTKEKLRQAIIEALGEYLQETSKVSFTDDGIAIFTCPELISFHTTNDPMPDWI